MNLTDEILHKYLEVFHKTYIDTAEKNISKNKLNSLLRYSLIKGGTIGYVSTQFGAGYEYLGEDVDNIHIQVSSARIEDVFTRAPRNIIKLKPMILLGGSNSTMSHVDMKGCFPFRLTTTNTSIRLIDVRFQALEWNRKVKFAELYGNRDSDFWSEKNAIIRAKDEIILALVEINVAAKNFVSLEEYLKTFKQKTVLILGDFSGSGLKRINNIKQILTSFGYMPITLKDVPDDPNYNLLQKAVAVASIARFIVIDDSSKSGHLFEFSHVEFNKWTTIVLRLNGSYGTFMTKGSSLYSTVILEESYTNSDLDQILRKSVKWAENTNSKLQRGNQEIYPWRKSVKKTETDSSH